mgnify:CR=1 FL=1
MKIFVCYFHFVSWVDISFGFSMDISKPYIEFHLPFGFVRIGLQHFNIIPPLNYHNTKWRDWGLHEGRYYTEAEEGHKEMVEKYSK